MTRYSDDYKGLTLGNFISGNSTIKANPRDPLFQHEYGHYIQSQESGPAYLTVYGIPSLLTNSHFHDHYPMEQDANIRAFKYFGKHVKNFHVYSSTGKYEKGWNFDENPIYGYNRNNVFDPNNAYVLAQQLNPSALDYFVSIMFPGAGQLIWGAMNGMYFNLAEYLNRTF